MTLLRMLVTVLLLGVSGLALAFDQAPAFTLNNLQESPVSLSNFKGKVIYVDFWATWCAPCRRSFPWMQQMYEKYHDLGLEIIAISLDGKKEVIDRFLKQSPVSFTILRDRRNKVASKYKVKVMPSSYLIDQDGNFYYRHAGFNDRDKTKLEERFRDLLLN